MSDKQKILDAIDIMVDGHEKVLLEKYADLTDYNLDDCRFILDRKIMDYDDIVKTVNYLVLIKILDTVKSIDVKLDGRISIAGELKPDYYEISTDVKDNYQPNHTVIGSKERPIKKEWKIQGIDAAIKNKKSVDVSAILKSVGVKK